MIMIKKILKRKKSQIHVEMIISFVIFVGFLIAIFFIINPLAVKKTDYTLINNLQDKVIENLSFDYSSVSLTLDEGLSFSGDCFIVSNPFNISSILEVQDTSGSILEASNNFLNKELIIDKSSTADKRYYKLYFSDEFNPSLDIPSGCSTLDEANYSFGLFVNNEGVLYENLVPFNNLYIQDYDKLKKELGIEGDFEFVIYDINRSVILNESLYKHRIKNINVISREMPLKTLDKNSQEKNIILNLRAW